MSPPPVTTITRTAGSSSRRLQIQRYSSCIRPVQELPRPGRSRVRVATPCGSISYRVTLRSTAPPGAGRHPLWHEPYAATLYTNSDSIPLDVEYQCRGTARDQEDG